MDNNYIVYHLHSDRSNCITTDSATNFQDYIDLAVKNNMKAIAFSEHGSIINWVKKKKACDKAGIKYIHGIELYLTTTLDEKIRESFHIGLYARNYEGVKEINELSSRSFNKEDNHFYYRPRISIDELKNTSSNIIITTACLQSILWRKKDDIIVNDLLQWMSNNKDRCFLEIQYHNYDEQINYNKLLYKWSEEYNLKLIAGTDTHSSNNYKAECRQILQKAKNMFYDEEDEFDLIFKTYNELINKFKEQNSLPEKVYLEAIKNTNLLYELVEDFQFDKTFKYPKLYKDENKLFKKTIKKMYSEKIKLNIIPNNNIYRDRIQEELKVFIKLGMASFMLFMSELCTWCNNNDIPIGYARGSVAGSLIAYILNITDLNPIQWNTVFSRFCNEDRIELGDIDLDFAPQDREKVFDYIINKSGKDYSCYILTTGTTGDKKTIDEIGRGLNIPLPVVEEIKNEFNNIQKEYTKAYNKILNKDKRDLDFLKHKKYLEEFKNANQLDIDIFNKIYQDFEKLKETNRDLFYYFEGIKGIVMSKGIHAAGIVASPITINDNIGLYYSDKENKLVSQLDMDEIHDINFIKYDILGLKNIGIIKDTYKLINSHYLKSHEINWNDLLVWNDISKSPVGIFQFEGEYAFDLLSTYSPKQINDLSLINASLRPSGKSYRDKLIAREINKNPSTEIDALLQENNGFLVFQEDTIKFLTNICGFSGGQADNIRRIIGRKKREEIEAELPKILAGYCKYSNKPKNIAEEEAKQFIQIMADSVEYQFGYNHSTAYSMIGYTCALLRYYYPLEFITAYLNNSANEDDITIGTKFANENNIKIESIQYGKSQAKYSCDKHLNTIYKGIESIKFLNSKIADELYELSKSNKYSNFLNLLIDINNQTSVDSRQLNILIKLNFFSEFGKAEKLLTIYKQFHTLNGKKQIKKDKIEELTKELYIPKDIDLKNMIIKYSGKETEKLHKELDSYSLLLELSELVPNESLSILNQLRAQSDYLGYIQTIIPELKYDIGFVTDVNLNYTPKVKVYHLNSGLEETYKIYKKQFNKIPLYTNDIIYISDKLERNKTKMAGKDEKNKPIWEQLDEKEWIINTYYKPSLDVINKYLDSMGK